MSEDKTVITDGFGRNYEMKCGAPDNSLEIGLGITEDKPEDIPQLAGSGLKEYSLDGDGPLRSCETPEPSTPHPLQSQLDRIEDSIRYVGTNIGGRLLEVEAKLDMLLDPDKTERELNGKIADIAKRLDAKGYVSGDGLTRTTER